MHAPCCSSCAAQQCAENVGTVVELGLAGVELIKRGCIMLATVLTELRNARDRQQTLSGLPRVDTTPTAAGTARLLGQLPIREVAKATLLEKFRNAEQLRSDQSAICVADSKQVIDQLQERHSAFKVMVESAKQRIAHLRQAYNAGLAADVDHGKQRMFVAASAAISKCIQAAIVTMDAAMREDSAAQRAQARDLADVRLSAVIMRVNEDAGSVVELAPCDPSADETAKAVANAAKGSEFAVPKRVIVVRDPGGPPPQKYREYRKKGIRSRAGALEALRTIIGGSLSNQFGVLRKMPEDTPALPLPPVHMLLDPRPISYLGADAEGALLYCVDERLCGIHGAADEISGLRRMKTALRGWQAQQVLDDAHGNYHQWVVVNSSDSAILAMPPTGGGGLLFGRACVRHLLETRHVSTLISRLPADARQILQTAYPVATAAENVLAWLWYVRNGRLWRVDKGMLHELFLVYVARTGSVAVTPYTALPHTDDVFVTVWPAPPRLGRMNSAGSLPSSPTPTPTPTPPTPIPSVALSGSAPLIPAPPPPKQPKPVAVVVMSGDGELSDSDTEADPMRLEVCAWRGCLAVPASGTRLCLLHFVSQKLRRAPTTRNARAPGYDAAAVETKFASSVTAAVENVLYCASDSVRKHGVPSSIAALDASTKHRHTAAKPRPPSVYQSISASTHNTTTATTDSDEGSRSPPTRSSNGLNSSFMSAAATEKLAASPYRAPPTTVVRSYSAAMATRPRPPSQLAQSFRPIKSRLG